jgi:predicted permease
MLYIVIFFLLLVSWFEIGRFFTKEKDPLIFVAACRFRNILLLPVTYKQVTWIHSSISSSGVDPYPSFGINIEKCNYLYSETSQVSVQR